MFNIILNIYRGINSCIYQYFEFLKTKCSKEINFTKSLLNIELLNIKLILTLKSPF